MTQSDASRVSPATHSSSSLLARIGWAALIVVTLYVCYFSHLGAIGFVGPDEPRYAWVARAMAETGDWVTPRLYGKPWFEKPVLYYWEAAASFKLFGVSEVAARLPSALSALFATLALAWLAWRTYGSETARWLLLLLPSTVGMIGFSHAAATDMPFSAMLTIAMVCAALVLGLASNEKTPLLPRTPWLALILFGFFLGLAVLAKGPAGIILSGGAVFFWAIFTKRWRDAFRLLHPAAISSFCLTALPWYILCALRNPAFFHVFIIEHNFQRYITPEFQHLQPLWYYFPIFLLAIVPWIVPLIVFLRDVAKRWSNNPLRTDTHALYLACWCAFTILFFSASKSKLPGYILPALPAFLLLLSASVARRFNPQAKKNRWIGIGCGLTLIVVVVCFGLSLDHIPFAADYLPPNPLNLVALLLALASLSVIVLGILRRSAAALAVTVLAIVVCLAWSLTGDARWALDEGITADFTSYTTPQLQARFAGKPVYAFKLKRSFQYSLNFRFHQELPEWSPDVEGPAWIFTSPPEMQRLRTPGIRCPAYVAYPAVIVCESFGSVPQPAGGGKMQ